MSFLATFLVVLATAATLAIASMRRFFLTNDAAGYVFVAINWGILLAATALVALLIQFLERLLLG